MQPLKMIQSICAIGALMLATNAWAQDEHGDHDHAPAPTTSLAVGDTTGTAEPINMMCPVTTDEEIDPSFTTIYKGQTIGLCCRKCRTRFESDPEAYLDELPMLQAASLTTSTSPESSSESSSDQAHDDSGGADHAHAPTDATDAADAADGGHDDAQEHDHAVDHGQEAGFKLLPFLGRFHILIIHFPIALLAVAGLFESIAIVRKNASFDLIVRAMVALGASSSVVAVVLGLMNAIEAEYAGQLVSIFWWHRALGIASMVVAIITWVLVEKRAKMEPGSAFMPARVSVLVSAALVGVAAHFGGSLVYGWTYLFP